MASQQPSSTSNAVTNTFTKGLAKDLNETFLGEGSWTHARNAVNNSHDGQTGVLGNEPSNISCVKLPYTLIGSIPLVADQWVLFTTDDTNSEIGLYDEGKCTYSKIVNDPCLKFNRKNLIIGAYRENFNCDRKVYWDDGLNPSRVMDIDNPPYIQKRTKNGACYTDSNTSQLDCEKLRLAPLLTIPCVTLLKGKGSGTLSNGTYQVAVAYVVNEIRITDYLILSEAQPIFSHLNESGALELRISGTDLEFDELEVAIIATVNQQTVVKRLGTYSTSQQIIYIDTIDPTLPTIPINLIPLRTPAVERSDSMYSVNNYLLRLGIYSKPDFNYQPQANKIKSKWVSVTYPADYYQKGGHNASYMRDEQYAFFIRWVYNTGDKSASYHIPGRTSVPDDLTNVSSGDAIEQAQGITPKKWQVYNTGSVTSLLPYTLSDGGIVNAEGEMGYWESTEIYPDDQPAIWAELCGLPIRHHKFPDNTVDSKANHFNPGGDTINILGVKFEGITHPLDNEGNPIESIIGYEILRGSREGQKTIIAKGIINNMREYALAGNSSQKGLFQNYPYNDLRPDSFLTPDRQNGTNGQVTASSSKMSGYRKDIYSFHSPETTFSKPFLSASELKVYQELNGISNGQFETPYKHSKFKLTTNADDVIGDIVGILSALHMFTNGIEIGSTEDYPIGLKVGPLPPFPMRDSDFYIAGLADGGSTHTDIATEIAYYANMAIWAGEAVSLIATMGKFAELEKEKFFSLIRTLIPKVQYAAQYNSHGFYDQFKPAQSANTRRAITRANYLSDNIQAFGTQYQINNLYRANSVIIQLNADLADPTSQEKSRNLISEYNVAPYTNVTANISSYYSALKVPLNAQYGQVDSVKQLPISTCISYTLPVAKQKFNSEVMFGGDVYINRFTEKNSFFYFYDWMFNLPDELEYDYTMYNNIPYPRFWINNTQYMRSILKVSSNYRVLDARDSSLFYVNKGYFYLFNSGVRDFFVESEVNLAYRDWDDVESKRFYDPYGYTDLTTMFRSDIIKSNNYFKYDYSLSNSKIFNSYISWGSVLSRDYDPLSAEKCFSYYPKRIMYSLPQDLELKKDNWKVFLPNNYKDMPSKVTSIKSINKSGALIMMKNDSPVQFMGVDQLQTDAGVKVTVGDGGLFNQPLQSITNSERTYQYGACQNKYAVTATNHGVFYVSQEAGKIFNFAGGLEEISNYGNKWWFSQYLPSQLLKQFPNFELFDNPVVGIGCQAIYDNTNEITYFTKKDYKAKDPRIVYYPGIGFGIPTGDFQTVVVSPAYQEIVRPAYTEIIRDAYDELVDSGADCTAPIDLVFVLDITGSMGSTINNMKSSIVSMAAKISAKSNGDYRLGLITVNEFHSGGTLHNDNKVRVALNAVNNLAAFQTAINAVTLGDGGDLPEPTDLALEALMGNVPINGVSPGSFRSNVIKMVILATDANPSGNDDRFTYGVDDVSVTRIANKAKAISVKIYPIATGSATRTPQIMDLMNNYAVITGGKMYQSPSGVVNDSVEDMVQNVPCPPVLVHHPAITVDHPAVIVDHPEVTKQVPIINYIELGDPNYFDDASWTVSYDPKNKVWLSFHDWHPTFVLPGKFHFMTVLKDEIWKHNIVCDSYCNFYGVDYPFEVEFVASTGQTVNTMRSVEYILETYQYNENCADRYHVLDNNFDRAIVYNSEQNSGMLKLNIATKNNPVADLKYPIISPSYIDILYSKEENKYRFNQFYDVTKDRGEFSQIPKAMFITQINGYVYQLNPSYIDYSKVPTEHKKFRHYSNKVFLRKMKSGSYKMIFKMINTKTLLSPR